MAITIEGEDLRELDKEAGGHRLQRIPPSEKRGRVHTSTVTVAILKDEKKTTSPYLKKQKEDFKTEWYNGTIKAGGQHHQKNATCCRLIHIPTGIVKTSQTRSRDSSLKYAMDAMTKELDTLFETGNKKNTNESRKNQVGSGQRGDKKRTYRFQDDTTIDHTTQKRARTTDVMNGRFDLLW